MTTTRIRVASLVAAATLAVTGLTVVLSPAHSADTVQDSSCTDGGGRVWKTQAIWSGTQVKADGLTYAVVDKAGFATTDSRADTADYSVKTYAGDGTLIQTLAEDNRPWYTDGRYLHRNPSNPATAPGRARVVISVGDGNDGRSNCSSTFYQPAEPTPTPTPTTPTVTPTPTATPTLPPASTEAAVLNGWGAPVAGDEFNYTGAPDPTKWSVYKGPGHSNNGTRNPDNVTVTGETLLMVGLPDGSTGGMSFRPDRADSSQVVVGATGGGRWETRIRVYGATPADYRASGYHPVAIIWPDAGRTCATKRQEIDYTEGTSDVTLARTYLHYANAECNDTTAGGHASRAVDQRDWHNYAVEWESDADDGVGHVTTWLDGVVLYHTDDPVKVPDYPSHSTLQLDNFLGDLSRSHLEADWHRYYPHS